MKTIEFRVWDTIQKQMYYPEEAKFCITMIGVVCDDLTDDGGELLNVNYRTVPLLWTGLKDKNGRKIYKGDIVQSTLQGLHVIRNFIEDAWWLKTTMADFGDAEIIGNIYENPELSEEK